jgi:hypothetical protein
MQFLRATSTAALVLLFGTIIPAYAQQEEKSEKKAEPEKQQSKPQPSARPQPQEKQAPRAEKAQPQPKQERAQQAPKPQPKEQQAKQAPRPQPKEQQAKQSPKPQPREQQAKQSPKPQPKEQQAKQAPKQQPREQQAKQAPKPQPREQQAKQTPKQQSNPQHAQAQPARPVPQTSSGHATRPQAVAWQKQEGWKQGGGWQGRGTWQQNGDQNWASDHRTWAQRGGYGGYFIPQTTYNASFGSQHWFRMGGMPSMYEGYPRFSYGGFWFLLVDPWPGSWAANWYADDDVYIDYDGGYYLCNRSYPGFRLAITVSL